MKINKHYATKLIFKIVCKLSRFPFPKWLKNTAKDYLINFNSYDEDYQRASVLAGDFCWKAISIVLPISPEELKSLDNWLNKNASKAVYHSNDNLTSTMYDSDGGFINFGIINFSEPSSVEFLANLNSNSHFSTGCYLSVSKLPCGFNYLSLYFILNNSATTAIRNIDTSTINGYYELASFNPFKQEFKIISIHSKSDVLREITSERINEVCCDVIRSAKSLLMNWGIKKQTTDLELIADIYRATDEKYFIDTTKATVTSPTTDREYVRISRVSHSFCDIELSKDNTEIFLCKEAINGTNLNGIFVKSEIKTSTPDTYHFSQSYLNIHDSHLIISILFSIDKQYINISKSANIHLIKKSKKPDVTYMELLKYQSMLDTLKEKITAFSKYSSMYCEKRYQNRTSQIALLIENKINTLNQSIDKRLSRLNSEIQANNLKFNRRYSIIVGALIIIQIIFAILSVDFDKFKEIENIEPWKVEIIIQP